MDIRPAATLVLVRDTSDGLEVLLLQRTWDAVFMPGYFVFPGGRVEEHVTNMDDSGTGRSTHCIGSVCLSSRNMSMSQEACFCTSHFARVRDNKSAPNKFIKSHISDHARRLP